MERAENRVNVRIGKFQTIDGLKLHYEHWSPFLPKATIVFVHGKGSCCGRHGPFVDYFTKRDYEVFLYDQRGHGQSEGEGLFAARFHLFLDDLATYLRFSLEGSSERKPLFLVGLGFGGVVALNFLAKYRHRFKAACVISPCKRISALRHPMKTPLYIFQDLEDRDTSVEATKRFFRELRLEKKRLKFYEGAYNPKEVFREMENWFDFIAGFRVFPVQNRSRQLPFAVA